MRASLLIAAAATAVTASPPPPQYHTILFTVNNNTDVLSANLLATKKSGVYYLQGERPSVYQGSQAFFTGSGDAEGLIFLPNSYTTAGAAVPEVGDNYGYAAPITVTNGTQGDVQWDYVKKTGKLYHQPQAALDTFLACTQKVNGKKATVLSYGVPKLAPSGEEAPDGCEYTTVTVGKYNTNA